MKKYSIYDTHTSRQARNLFEDSIADTVRPWFADIESAEVQDAVNALRHPMKRWQAARYLGIELVPCA